MGGWSLVLALAILAVLSACGPTVPDRSLQRIKDSGQLVVGIDPTYPPFENIDAGGNLVGYDVDLAREVARRLGVAVSFVTVDVGGIHDALIARKLDAVISSLPPYPELSKQIAFSRPYFNAGQMLVVRDHADGSDRIVDVDSIGRQGGIIAIETGSAADLEMRNLTLKFPNLSVRRFFDPQGALLEVRAGRSDAAIVDAISALDYIARTGGVEIVGRPITVEPYVVSTRKTDPALSAEIDRIIVDLGREGFLSGLEKQWLGKVEQ